MKPLLIIAVGTIACLLCVVLCQCDYIRLLEQTLSESRKEPRISFYNTNKVKFPDDWK